MIDNLRDGNILDDSLVDVDLVTQFSTQESCTGMFMLTVFSTVFVFVIGTVFSTVFVTNDWQGLSVRIGIWARP
jgi:hypothetical protein